MVGLSSDGDWWIGRSSISHTDPYPRCRGLVQSPTFSPTSFQASSYSTSHQHQPPDQSVLSASLLVHSQAVLQLRWHQSSTGTRAPLAPELHWHQSHTGTRAPLAPELHWHQNCAILLPPAHYIKHPAVKALMPLIHVVHCTMPI